MIGEFGPYWIFIGIAIVFFVAGQFALHSILQSNIPKSRFFRVSRHGTLASKEEINLPTIVAQRQCSMVKNENLKKRAFLLSFLQTFENLTQESGLPFTAFHCFFAFFVLTGISSFCLSALTSVNILFALSFSVVCNFLLIMTALNFSKQRQVLRFQENFPEALDLIVRSVRAGLPVSEAFRVISNEVAAPVCNRFQEVANNLSIGMTLDEALAILERKMPIPEVRFFTVSLTIQKETGGNLAEILMNLATIMRRRLQLKNKVRALSSEARASALIIGSLPFLVGALLYVLNRDYIELLFSDELGRSFLFAAIGSIFLGALVMMKLMRFED